MGVLGIIQAHCLLPPVSLLTSNEQPQVPGWGVQRGRPAVWVTSRELYLASPGVGFLIEPAGLPVAVQGLDDF